MNSVPVEKIDALIASLEKKAYMSTTIEIAPFEVELDTLRGLKKESEEMIPLSVVDTLIKSIGDSGGAVYSNNDVIEILEGLKK